MCNLYSITTNQAAIIALFRVVNRYVGNLASMPGVFPDYKAPIVRNGTEGRELATARWGMPSSQHALMAATKKRATKLEAKGKPVDFKELLRMEPDGGTTNIRNVKSKHWTRWLGAENRCVVPFNSFSEFNKAAGGDVWFALDKTRPLACFAGIWTNWTSVRKVKKGDPRARDRARRRPPALLRTRPSPKLATHSTRSATPFRNACPTSGDRERMVRQST
jgi:putative SOS response-associated peptidase YedK